MCACVSNLNVEHNKSGQSERRGEKRRAVGGTEGVHVCMYMEILTLQFGSEGQQDGGRLGVIYHGKLSKDANPYHCTAPAVEQVVTEDDQRLLSSSIQPPLKPL